MAVIHFWPVESQMRAARLSETPIARVCLQQSDENWIFSLISRIPPVLELIRILLDLANT